MSDRVHDIAYAATCIREGKCVAFPTETVYGLGADGLNPLAVARIFELKERPHFDPLILHIAQFDDLERLVARMDPRAFVLAEKFWPGPLTMILPKSTIVPDIVTSGLPTVGIRMPAHDIALALIKSAGCPIAAPSANKFGRISPTTAQHVRKQLSEVDYILDGGKTTVGIESTIIQLTERGFHIVRNGLITKEELEAILPFDPHATHDTIVAPGMIKSHYSPIKKMIIAEDTTLTGIDIDTAALISFSGRYDTLFRTVVRLTHTNDLKEYAVQLFAAMHSLEDNNAIQTIVAEPVPEEGIGKAIMDKLRKATYNWKTQ